MSIRSFLGLCEHRWQDEDDIEKKVRDRVSGEVRIIEIRRVQRCTICGSVRSVVL